MYLIGFFACLLLAGVVTFIRKVALKERLESGLGHKVKDSDLTSINAWMDAMPDPNQSQRPKASSSSRLKGQVGAEPVGAEPASRR